jgi:hypothetical protein
MIIFSQNLKELHNIVECQHNTLSINGKVGTTTFGGCATNIFGVKAHLGIIHNFVTTCLSAMEQKIN